MAGLIENSIDRDDPYSSVSGYSADLASMDDSDSVESRVKSITQEDSPLMQASRTRAKQAGQSRGLLNSTMSVQAGEAAVYDTAIPIASQDANTSASFKMANQNAENTANQFTASQKNQARGLIEQGNQSIRQIKESGEQTRSNQDNQGTIASDLQREGYEQDIGRYGAQGDQTRLNIQSQTDSQSQLQSEASQQRLSEMSAGFNYDKMLQELRGEQAENLTQIETRNSLLIQSSQSAAIVFGQHAEAIGNILANPDIPANQKQGLINKQIQLLDNAMQIQGAISDTNLGDILQWDTGDSSLGNLPGAGASTTPNTNTANNGGSSGGNNSSNGEGSGQQPGGGYKPGVEGLSPEGDAYFVPAGFNWGGFINQHDDLKAAYQNQTWASSPEQWANELWASQAIASGDPRFMNTFGLTSSGGSTNSATGGGTNNGGTTTGGQTAAEQQAQQEAEQQAQQYVEQDMQDDTPATDTEKTEAVSGLKDAGWSAQQIAEYAASQYGGTAADYINEVNRFY